MADEIVDTISNIVDAVTPAQTKPKTPKVKKSETSIKKPERQSRKVKVQPKTIEEFYIARGKDPTRFIITETGDLFAPGIKADEPARTFTLPKYRGLTLTEKVALDSARREQLAILEIAVQEAQTKLRDLYLGYKNGDVYPSDIVIANQEVALAEMALQKAAYPLKQVNTHDNLEIRKILLDSRYEDRKIPYSVHIFKHFPYELQAEVSEAPLVEAPPQQQEQEQEQPQPQPQDQQPREMTAADRGRLGGILKVRRSRPQ